MEAVLPLVREHHARQEKVTVAFEVEDPEVRAELLRHTEGNERDRFAAQALRIGVLALRQANGLLDAEAVRREGDALFARLREELVRHGTTVAQSVGGTLARYFDPREGLLPERLDRLVRPGGELHAAVDKVLLEQRAQLLREFSLDNQDSALSRLVAHFSGDRPDSFGARFAQALEETRSAVAQSLTLDDEDSPLARLRREMRETLDQLARDNGGFREELRSTLEAFRARREAEARSTEHGRTFESAVMSWLTLQAQRAGDMLHVVKDRPGAIPRCKVGDFVWVFGAESAAANERIAIEVKEDRTYDLKRALEEIAVARENRQASLGLFVFSRAVVQAGMEPVSRYSNDVVVFWDAEDSTTDAYLRAGLSIVRALAVRQKVAIETTSASVVEMEQAVSDVVRQVSELDQIKTWGETVRASGVKIVEKAQSIRTRLEKTMTLLEENIGRLKRGQAPPR